METLYEVVGNYIEPWIPCCDGFCSEQDHNESQYCQSAKGVRKTIGYYKTMKEARESKDH